MPVKNLDIVGTYLNSLSSAEATDIRPTNTLLSVLAGHIEPMEYKDFWKAAHLLGYTGVEFSSAFRRLRSTGAVRLQPRAGQDGENPLVQLTALGKSVADVVRREGTA